MRVDDKFEGNLLDYAGKLSDYYSNVRNADIRKFKGQFFTPQQVGKFMANLFEIDKNKIELLDPGAGTGMLSCAFCDRLLDKEESVSLNIDAYENDPGLIPLLKKTLEACRDELRKRGHELNFKIHEQDFILHNAMYFKKNDLFGDQILKLYDFVLSNPPYYKLNKNSPQSTVMIDLISGQPNIYALFMALSTSMLKTGGELVFITPRSFCSGLYYKRFREWFLDNTQILHIHIFESRKDIFDKDSVLQENIIIKAKKVNKGEKKNPKVTISKSKDKLFKKVEKINFSYSDIIHHKNRDVVIRIPTSEIDNKVMSIIDSWPNTLHSLGMEISTGPVVPFRAKEYLLEKYHQTEMEAPLLWMHNIQDMKVIWPTKKNNKELAISICPETRVLLLPRKNYVLVKRFSSKEQKRRLYAGILSASEIEHDVIGLENHVNYIHKPKRELSVDETHGIASLLNSSIVDNFFRSVNGNTQVNATDIRLLPLPSIDKIREIGNYVRKTQPKIGFELDSIISKILNIDREIINRLNEGEKEYEQD